MKRPLKKTCQCLSLDLLEIELKNEISTRLRYKFNVKANIHKEQNLSRDETRSTIKSRSELLF